MKIENNDINFDTTSYKYIVHITMQKCKTCQVMRLPPYCEGSSIYFHLINFSSSFLWIDKICPVYTRIKNKQLSFVTRGYVVFKISNCFSTINHTMICRIMLICIHINIIGNISTLYLEIYSAFSTSIFWTTLHHWFWFIYYFVWMTFLIFMILIIGENHIDRDI